MWNQTNRSNYEAGLELLTQEYRVALADIKDDYNLTSIDKLRLRHELAKDYRRHRVQEREAIDAQLYADHEVTQQHPSGE